MSAPSTAKNGLDLTDESQQQLDTAIKGLLATVRAAYPSGTDMPELAWQYVFQAQFPVYQVTDETQLCTIALKIMPTAQAGSWHILCKFNRRRSLCHILTHTLASHLHAMCGGQTRVRRDYNGWYAFDVPR